MSDFDDFDDVPGIAGIIAAILIVCVVLAGGLWVESHADVIARALGIG